MKVPHITNWTIRKSRFGFTAWVQDELGYWWTCDFVREPELFDIRESWKSFFIKRKPTWHMMPHDP